MTKKKPDGAPVTPVLQMSAMNDEHEPITWPLLAPSALSEDAQLVHHHGRSGRQLDRDLFDAKARRGYSGEEGYQPSERMLAAIAELEGARLGSYSPDTKFLYLNPVHPLYTVAHGRGSQLIRVSVVGRHSGEEGQLLAVLVGGDLESRGQSDRDLAEVAVRSRHEDATDVEHDASSTAQLVVTPLSAPRFLMYGHLEFTALVLEARLYPHGADPLTQKGFDPSELCRDCEEPHPYAPFLPPEVELPAARQGTIVRIECLPLRPYLVMDEASARDATETDAGTTSAN